MATQGSMPLKRFGKMDLQISALGLGGHHLGAAKDEETAVAIVHAALDGGITFFDNCWEYNRGKSEDWLGKGLKGRRDNAFLMTKVCTHGRDASLATQMLEQSLRRLQTDHLDLMADSRCLLPERSGLIYSPRRCCRSAAQGEEGRQGPVRGFYRTQGPGDPSRHVEHWISVRRSSNAAESV